MQVLDLNFSLLVLFSFIFTIAGVEFWRRFALKRNHLDIPNERSSHYTPTPRGGGIIIFVVTVSFFAFWAWQNNILSLVLPFFLGAGIIAFISWLDDLYSLPSLLRFGVHTLAAIIAIFFINFFQQFELPLVSLVNLNSVFGILLTLIWIVGLTNAYNFMDGIDGIAGIQGLIAGLGWCFIGLITQQALVAVLGALLASACAGFLYHNWHPARIFMGDVGSAFLGYTLAVLPLYAAKKTSVSTVIPIVGVMLVWTFVFDTILTFIRRTIRGEEIFSAHRSHLYQRLVIKGFRHDTVSIMFGLLSLAGIVAAIFFINQPTSQFVIYAFLILTFLAICLWMLVIIVENLKMNPQKNK